MVKPFPLCFTVILLMFLKLMILLNFFIMIYEALPMILASSQPYPNLKYT